MPLKAGGGVLSKMQALSRACRYPWRPREQQPPPGTVTLSNAVEIISNLYTHLGQPRGYIVALWKSFGKVGLAASTWLANQIRGFKISEKKIIILPLIIMLQFLLCNSI